MTACNNSSSKKKDELLDAAPKNDVPRILEAKLLLEKRCWREFLWWYFWDGTLNNQPHIHLI